MAEEGAATKDPWSDSVNNEKIVDLAAELGKDTASKGSFKEDYDAISEVLEIVACPRIDVLQGGVAVRLTNTCIDLASWRAMLLAISTAGSPVKELSIHACEVSAEHMSDLVTALEKIGDIDVLKLDYLRIKLAEDQEGSYVGASFISVLSSEKFSIKYLSLRGSLGDEFVSSESFYTALVENVALQSLNLSGNSLSDTAVSAVMRALRVNANVTEVSLGQNACSGECIADLANLLSGVEVTPEEDAAWKNVTKLIGDKNKAAKDANKNRKKKGYPDLEDVATPAERVVKVGEVNCIANRKLRVLDMSFCPLDVASFQAGMQGLQSEHKVAEPALELILLVRGRADDLVLLPPPPTETPAESGDIEEKVQDTPPGVPGLQIVY